MPYRLDLRKHSRHDPCTQVSVPDSEKIGDAYGIPLLGSRDAASFLEVLEEEWDKDGLLLIVEFRKEREDLHKT